MRTKDNGKNGTAENTGKKKHAAFTWFKRVTVVFCAVVMYFAVTIGVRGYDMYKDAIAQVSLKDKVSEIRSKESYTVFSDHSTNLRTTAKELLVPERRFVRSLLEKRFVYRTASGNVLPYAKPANEGLFCVKDYCNHGHIGSYTLITPQGKLYFAQLRDMILMVV